MAFCCFSARSCFFFRGRWDWWRATNWLHEWDCIEKWRFCVFFITFHNIFRRSKAHNRGWFLHRFAQKFHENFVTLFHSRLWLSRTDVRRRLKIYAKLRRAWNFNWSPQKFIWKIHRISVVWWGMILVDWDVEFFMLEWTMTNSIIDPQVDQRSFSFTARRSKHQSIPFVHSLFIEFNESNHETVFTTWNIFENRKTLFAQPIFFVFASSHNSASNNMRRVRVEEAAAKSN